MFEKSKIKNEIKKMQKQIALIEQKRVRSQAALVEAILTNSTPDDGDVDYFNKYTEEINAVRNDMQELEIKLSKM